MRDRGLYTETKVNYTVRELDKVLTLLFTPHRSSKR